MEEYCKVQSRNKYSSGITVKNERSKASALSTLHLSISNN